VGKSFIPNGYRYTVDDRYRDYEVNDCTGDSSVLHLKNHNPLSDWYGLSPLEVAIFSIDQHNQSSAWNQALLQNGARPSGAIMIKNSQGQGCKLNEEQFSKLKAMFTDAYSGPENAGRPLLLEGGLEWQTISMTPRDMDYIESKNSAAREISLALGVPPQLLGIPGDNTYSNLAEARVAMWEQMVIPLVENTINHLNKWLAQYWPEENLQLSCDLSSISALSSRTDATWNRLLKNNFMTINEKRQEIGLPPLENGDLL